MRYGLTSCAKMYRNDFVIWLNDRPTYVIFFIKFRAKITSNLFFAYKADVFLGSDGLWQVTDK